MRRHRSIAIGCGSALAVVLALLYGLYYWGQHPNWGNLRFDAPRWRAAKRWDAHNVRGKMVRSLLREYDLVGMTRSQVERLLGPPDGAGRRVPDDLRVPAAIAARAPRWWYLLGAYSGFRIDYDFLVLQFDDHGRVRRWRIVPS